MNDTTSNHHDPSFVDRLHWNERRNKDPAFVPNLINYDLDDAPLEGFNLSGASLQGAKLRRANLSDAILEGADLEDAKLRGAKLRGAKLRGAKLRGAKLRGAKLTGANLEQTDLRGVSFADCQLDNAKFWEANLAEADLRAAQGLKEAQLGGTDVRHAKLPDALMQDGEFFKQGLTHVEDIARNLQQIFLVLLAACLYCCITIASTSHAQLIANTAAIELPLIGAKISILGFYFLTPCLLLIIYMHYHLYMQRLWEAFVKLPAIFPEGTSLDERTYPRHMSGFIRASYVLLAREPIALETRLYGGLFIFLTWMSVPLTHLFFWFSLLPRRDNVGQAGVFLLIPIFIATVFGVRSFQRAVATLNNRKSEREHDDAVSLRLPRWPTFVLAAFAVIFFVQAYNAHSDQTLYLGWSVFLPFILAILIISIYYYFTSFKIDLKSLKKLESAGIPRNILNNLETITDQKVMDEKRFLETFQEKIGEEQTNKHKSLILKHTRSFRNILNSFKDIPKSFKKNILNYVKVLYIPGIVMCLFSIFYVYQLLVTDGDYTNKMWIVFSIWWFIIFIVSLLPLIFLIRSHLTLKLDRPMLYVPGVMLVTLVVISLFKITSPPQCIGEPLYSNKSALRKFFNAIFCYPTVNLTTQDMSIKSANWPGFAWQKENLEDNKSEMIRGVSLRKANLRYSIAPESFFVKADLRQSQFISAMLEGADFRWAKLQGSNFADALLARTNFFRADLRGSNFKKATLVWSDFSEAQLHIFTNCDVGCLIPVNFYKANLYRANFFEADLKGANLTEANLQYANLDKALLNGADLKKANLQFASLKLSSLNNLRVNRIKECFYNKEDYIENQQKSCRDSRTELPGTDLTSADLSGAKLEGADLSGVKLESAKLSCLKYSENKLICTRSIR